MSTAMRNDDGVQLMTKPSDELLRRAGELGNSLPHCCGYPKCDGDLVAEPHSEGCPMFPDEKELTSIEFAAQFAEQIVRECSEIARDKATYANTGTFTVENRVMLLRETADGILQRFGLAERGQ